MVQKPTKYTAAKTRPTLARRVKTSSAASDYHTAAEDQSVISGQDSVTPTPSGIATLAAAAVAVAAQNSLDKSQNGEGENFVQGEFQAVVNNTITDGPNADTTGIRAGVYRRFNAGRIAQYDERSQSVVSDVASVVSYSGSDVGLNTHYGVNEVAALRGQSVVSDYTTDTDSVVSADARVGGYAIYTNEDGRYGRLEDEMVAGTGGGIQGGYIQSGSELSDFSDESRPASPAGEEEEMLNVLVARRRKEQETQRVIDANIAALPSTPNSPNSHAKRKRDDKRPQRPVKSDVESEDDSGDKRRFERDMRKAVGLSLLPQRAPPAHGASSSRLSPGSPKRQKAEVHRSYADAVSTPATPRARVPVACAPAASAPPVFMPPVFVAPGPAAQAPAAAPPVAVTPAPAPAPHPAANAAASATAVPVAAQAPAAVADAYTWATVNGGMPSGRFMLIRHDTLPLCGRTPEAMLGRLRVEILEQWAAVPGVKLLVVLSGFEGTTGQKREALLDILVGATNALRNSFVIGIPPTGNDVWMVAGLPENVANSLVAAGRIVTTGRLVAVYSFQPAIPNFLGSILGFIGFTDAHQVWLLLTQMLRGNRAFTEFITRNSDNVPANIPADETVEAVINTLYVHAVEVTNRSGQVKPAWSVYMYVPTSSAEAWDTLRRLFRSMSLDTAFNGSGRVVPNFRCRIDTATDHATEHCPLLALPNWIGPTVASLDAIRAANANAQKPPRGDATDSMLGGSKQIKKQWGPDKPKVNAKETKWKGKGKDRSGSGKFDAWDPNSDV
ncbi:hypothetical protein FB45DRAFT_1081812 [Roridomyces roridus]|uniref:Uncharacterized protein n=1 Tax=Roridomyces roridus TaxID=1738132 RepID=A0AAD7FM60_9AGAR|nr:hypothetical protein FB45DRAFT_1081812 [Roridomyces roridus]